MKNSGQTVNIFNSPFSQFVEEYDKWYEENFEIYQAELKAISLHLPKERSKGLEIGVGTARFAAPLGANLGIDPAIPPLKIALKRGVLPICAKGESLPFKNNSFNFVLLITTLCFLENPFQVLKEAYRCLKSKGRLIVGFINLNSPLGKKYEKKKKTSPFYSKARFYSLSEVCNLLKETGFKNLKFSQTLLPEKSRFLEVELKADEGGFVAVSGEKS